MEPTNQLSQHIGQVKDKWRREFRETVDQIKDLQRKLDDLKAKLVAADEILYEAKSAQQSQEPLLEGVGKYAGMGIADAVRAFFTEHKYTGHSISDITTRLGAEGVKTESQNLKQIVYQTCRRLELDHFLRSEFKDGYKVFKLEDAKNGALAAKK